MISRISPITVALTLLACQPNDTGGDTRDQDVLPDDHPMVVAVNNCLRACARISAGGEEKHCPGVPTLLDCDSGCKFAAKIDRCVPEFIDWSSCRADKTNELACSLEKRKPVFVGCDASEENFQRCVGHVL
ncbi:MAG: hypothetical protein IPI67_37205 [Myxococcales bacterium]|nr:hypothetical protein [Myxococcales bacterium]